MSVEKNEEEMEKEQTLFVFLFSSHGQACKSVTKMHFSVLRTPSAWLRRRHRVQDAVDVLENDLNILHVSY